jgi:hypothetical protein
MARWLRELPPSHLGRRTGAGIGFVLQQAVAEQAPKIDFLRPRLLLDLLRHPRWLAWVATMAAGQLLSAWVLGHVILSVAEPLLTANLLFALLLVRAR